MAEELIPGSRRRALRGFYFVSAAFLVLVFRLFWLETVRYDFYKEISYDQRLRTIILSPDRGDIYDRSGNVLATSIDSYSVFAVPTAIRDKQSTSAVIGKVLGIPAASVYQKINVNKPFVWVKRKIEVPLAKKLKSKNIPGIGFLTEKKRVYPKNRLAAQILGFVGADNQGLAGLELSFDDYLRGEEGRLITERDPRGTRDTHLNLRTIRSPSDGMNLTLTIDEPMQFFAEKQIKKMVEQSNSVSGTVIAMDIKSGEILALASYPAFDPKRLPEVQLIQLGEQGGHGCIRARLHFQAGHSGVRPGRRRDKAEHEDLLRRYDRDRR